MGKLSSAFEDIKRSALSEYFEKLKGSVVSLTEWITRNQERILTLVRVFAEHFSKVWELMQELASYLWEVFGEAVKWIASCFKESNKELDTFTILLKTIQTISVGVIAALQVIIESVKLVINSFKLLINNAMAAGNAIEWAFSSGAQAAAAKASLENRMKDNEKIWADMKGKVSNMGSSLVDSYTQILDIWNGQQESVNKSLEENTTS